MSPKICRGATKLVNPLFAFKSMRLIVYCLVVLSASARAFANIDDWLIDTENDQSLGLRYGVGENGLSIAGVNGELNLPFRYGFLFDYFRTNESINR